ncbi:hypothetical protein [Bartonella tribocorum]|uniref:Membrane protein n=1 Tax=Bartonella tribocorum (strain DSM 28219 / CCUG 45778 / CIP 105476 / IBS 506) TaxID=382640 RepID=A9IQ96_BART1|nr:hypothetical protein [Bartonella tribocorum]CAK01029.1 putative membrane protein [Bartonella tribocorum CIP 105476]CDO48235.1 putative integral membrane protein [Bartonella tribocorum]
MLVLFITSLFAGLIYGAVIYNFFRSTFSWINVLLSGIVFGVIVLLIWRYWETEHKLDALRLLQVLGVVFLLCVFHHFLKFKLVVAGAVGWFVASCIGGGLLAFWEQSVIKTLYMMNIVETKSRAEQGLALVFLFLTFTVFFVVAEEVMRRLLVTKFYRCSPSLLWRLPLNIGIGWGLCELVYKALGPFLVYNGWPIRSSLLASEYVIFYSWTQASIFLCALMSVILMHILNTFLAYRSVVTRSKFYACAPFFVHAIVNCFGATVLVTDKVWFNVGGILFILLCVMLFVYFESKNPLIQNIKLRA